MNTCKNCKHWRRGSYFTYAGTYGVSELKTTPIGKGPNGDVVLVINDKQKVGLCFHPANIGEYIEVWTGIKKEERVDGVRGVDADSAGICDFGEDFGCIHFESK